MSKNYFSALYYPNNTLEYILSYEDSFNNVYLGYDPFIKQGQLTNTFSQEIIIQINDINYPTHDKFPVNINISSKKLEQCNNNYYYHWTYDYLMTSKYDISSSRKILLATISNATNWISDFNPIYLCFADSNDVNKIKNNWYQIHLIKSNYNQNDSDNTEIIETSPTLFDFSTQIIKTI